MQGMFIEPIKPIDQKALVDVDRVNIEDAVDQIANIIGTDSNRPRIIRKHTSEVKNMALALFSLGHSHSAIGRILNVPQSTVHAWAHGYSGDDIAVSEMADRLKRSISDRLISYANVVIEKSLDPEKLAKASTLQLATTAGIYLEKSRLFAGESTSNIAHSVTRVSDIDGKLQDIDAEISTLEQALGE